MYIWMFYGTPSRVHRFRLVQAFFIEYRLVLCEVLVRGRRYLGTSVGARERKNVGPVWQGQKGTVRLTLSLESLDDHE